MDFGPRNKTEAETGKGEQTMKEFLKQIKADYVLSSIVCIVLGVIFVVWRGGVIDVIGTILSIGMILIGIIYLGSFILSLATFGASTIVGILILAVGIWFLIQPSMIVSLIPMIIGVGLIFHGIRGITEALNARKYGYEKWGMNLTFAIICLVFGLICVFCPLGVLKKFIMLVGIILIIAGGMNLWISATATRAARDYKRRTETVDTAFVEDEGKDRF